MIAQGHALPPLAGDYSAVLRFISQIFEYVLSAKMRNDLKRGAARTLCRGNEKFAATPRQTRRAYKSKGPNAV